MAPTDAEQAEIVRRLRKSDKPRIVIEDANGRRVMLLRVKGSPDYDVDTGWLSADGHVSMQLDGAVRIQYDNDEYVVRLPG